MPIHVLHTQISRGAEFAVHNYFHVCPESPDGTRVVPHLCGQCRRVVPAPCWPQVRWRNTMVAGKTALLVGERHVLELTIEAPDDAVFGLEVLEEESKANHKEGILNRLSFTVEPGIEVTTRVRARVLPQP